VNEGAGSAGLDVCATDLPATCRGTAWERPGEWFLVVRDSMTIAAGRELVAQTLGKPRRDCTMLWRAS
jgi:hypothetical protein